MTEIKIAFDGTGPAGWLAQAASRWPRSSALIANDDVLSFSALSKRVSELGRRREFGTGPLALSAVSNRDLALGVYAALQRGIPVLPLGPGPSQEDASRLMGDCGIERQIDCSTLQIRAAARVHGRTQPLSHAAALLVPSSGSGGFPKVAMLSPSNLGAAVRSSAARLPLQAGDLWLACLPLGHVGGLSVLLRCVRAGAGVLLHEGFDAERVWRDLQGYPVSHISLVPAMLHRLLDLAGDRPPPAGLRMVLVGGGSLDPALAHRARTAGWPLCVTYGMSETGSQVATLCGSDAGLHAGRVGRPLEGFELRIADPDSLGVGRILLRGPAVMAGYARPGLAPGLGLEQGWLVTGDLGRLLEDGVLEVVGRADDLLISGGEQVHPAQVEPLLQRCPGIGAAALSASSDAVWGDLLVAVYTGSVSSQEVDAYCRRRFKGSRRPRRFLRCHELPSGRSGKLDRQRLRALVEKTFEEPEGDS